MGTLAVHLKRRSHRLLRGVLLRAQRPGSAQLYYILEETMSGFNNAEFHNARSRRKLAKSKVKPIRKVKHLIKFIQEDGWYLDRIRGSHRHFKHPIKPGIVTVPKQLNADLAPGTLNSALKQAGLKN